MAQYDIYLNPGSRKQEIPYLVSVQNDHITSRTGATVVIPLRANSVSVEILAPWVTVEGVGSLVLSTDELFAIEMGRLKNAVGQLLLEDRAKIRPAIDKVVGDY